MPHLVARILRHDTYAGLLLMFGAVIIWSFAEIGVRFVHEAGTPAQFVAIRVGIGALFLTAFLPFDMRARGLRFNPRIVFHGAWLGALGITAASFSFHTALEHTGAGVVAVTFGASPLLAFIFSRLVLGEPLTWPRLLGVMLGFAGICVLGMSEESFAFSLFGFSMAMVNVVLLSLFTVMVKRFGPPFEGLPFTWLCLCFGFLFILPVVAWEQDPAILSTGPKVWGILLLLGLGPTGVAYLMFYRGLQRTDPTMAMSTVLLKPPLATLMAFVLLGEPLTWNLAGALILVVGGLYLVVVLHQWRARRAMAQAEADCYHPRHEHP